MPRRLLPFFQPLLPHPASRYTSQPGLLWLLLALTGWVTTSGTGFAQSLRFDGKKSLLLRNSAPALTSDSFTIETWIFFSDWYEAPDQSTIVSSEDDESFSGFAFRAGGTRGQAAQLSFSLVIQGAWTETRSPPLLATGRWYHVAAVVRPRLVTLYLDGQRVAQSVVLPGYQPSRRDLRVGESPFENHRRLNGAIDELRIWSKARSQTDINRDRTASLRGNETGLLAYFPMDSWVGTTTPNGIANVIRGEFQAGEGSFRAAGYSQISEDVGVEAIEGPDVFTARLGPRRVKVTVRNHGAKAVKLVPLVYRLNGREVLRDTLRGTLEAGASTTHRTLVPLDCLPQDSSQLEVYTALPTDAWPRNDTARAVYRKPGSTRQVVAVFDSSWHYFREPDFGTESVQFRFRRVVLPEDNHRTSRILMHVSLACPEKGCDPWDQVGQIFLFKNGEQYELGRFITPYGVACGPWTLDVTDFKSVLQGNCLIQSYIRAFSPQGWKLSVSFEFLETGPNPHPYQRLTPLWQHDYLLYGDPRFAAAHLPDTPIQLSPQTRVATLRHTITGHGQDNADNAAEFARKTHLFVLKGAGRPDSTVIPHLLWRADCAKNPCAGQKGSAVYSRAGWCPGQAVRPFSVGLPLSKEPFTLGYRFQPYQNQRPYIPKDYPGMPNFLIHSYLIEKSDSLRGFARSRNVACQQIDLTGDQLRVRIANTGTEAMDNVTLHWFVNGNHYAREGVGEALNVNEERVIVFKKRLPSAADKSAAISVLVEADEDENASDDVANLTISPP